MATIWTDEDKYKWFRTHPCKKKNGEVGKPHKNGSCMNCGGCIICEKPPWCTAHVKADNPRLCKRVPIRSPASETPAKRHRPPSFISPQQLGIERRLDDFDKEADAERNEGNKLGNLFRTDLNDLEEMTITPEKEKKLLSLVVQIINHLVGQDQEKFNKMAKRLAQGLDPTAKAADNLNKNLAALIIDGSQATRQISLALLLSSFTDKQARKILLDNNYSERRQKKTVANIKASNDQRRRAAIKRGETTFQREIPSAILEFTKPLDTPTRNAKHRRNFKTYLMKGVDIPCRAPTTKIDVVKMMIVVSFLYSNCQYRPGRIRNCRVHGHLLKNLPMYIRYSSVYSLFNGYLDTHHYESQMVSYNTFRTIVNALTWKGTYNQGLSYYYVDFIDKIDFLRSVRKRLSAMVEGVEDSNHVRGLIKRLGRQTEFASKYLRHGFYGRLVDNDPNNLYVSALWALGAESANEQPTPEPTDPLILVFTLKALLYEISDRMEALLSGDDDDTTDDGDEPDDLIEIRSIKPMADIMEKELMYYTKHLVRGYWQEKQEVEMKKRLKEKPGTLFIVLDHKAKTKCIRKHESMVSYYGKTGMSLLGAMVSWHGSLQGKEGLHVYFFDIVLHNTASQKAPDVMAGIETVLDGIESPEFQYIYSKTSPVMPKEIILCSDNALCNKAHTPYIQWMNTQREVQVTDWINNEAQRGKGFLDSHFRYINIHIKDAVLDGNINMGDQEKFYECLGYKGGLHASAAFLLDKTEEAQDIMKACKRVKYDDAGTQKLHHISWNAGQNNDRIIHRHFTNMASINGGYKEFPAVKLTPKMKKMSAGKVLKRSYRESTEPGKGVTIFLPYKCPDDSASPFYQAPSRKGEYKAPADNLFAGRLYKVAGWIHKFGGLPAEATEECIFTDELEKEGTKDEKEAKEIQELLKAAKELSEDRQRLTQDDPDPADCRVFQYPPKSLFDKYWAMKVNRNYVHLDDEVMKMFHEMYDQGKGYKNKDKKMTPERMVLELKASKHVKRRFDQQLMITVPYIQSKIMARAQREKKNADKTSMKKLRQKTSNDDAEGAEEPNANEGNAEEDNGDQEAFEDDVDGHEDVQEVDDTIVIRIG